MISNADIIIKVSEAEQNGISMKMVGICREIRNLAKLDRIQLYETTHRSGLNKQLYSYIEYCGIDVKDYIKDCLANLQPYMLERFFSQEPIKNFICVLDHMYRISLYIKHDKFFGKEVIVSFHENNKRGIAQENNMIQNKPDYLVPVFADEICARIDGAAKEEIKVLMQRGMLLLPVRIMGQKCENGVYIVNEQELEIPIIEQCNQYLRDMYTSDLDLAALDKVELFSVLHQIPFTSYGNTVFSNISLLIDNLALQKSTIGKKAADFALVTYVEHLILDDDQAIELIGLLDEKYKVKSQRGLDLILERVKDGLEAKMRQIGAEETETIETARINRKRGR
jgi:hypothetical protein